MFQAVNRPHEDLSLERMVDGLTAFVEQYPGECRLEVFLLAGYTAVDSEVERIVERVRRVRPDRVQLNTVTRPGAGDQHSAQGVPWSFAECHSVQAKRQVGRQEHGPKKHKEP